MRDSAGAAITLNAANEVAVEYFLDSRIRFDQIAAVVGQVLERAGGIMVNSLEQVLEIDQMARSYAMEMLREIQ